MNRQTKFLLKLINRRDKANSLLTASKEVYRNNKKDWVYTALVDKYKKEIELINEIIEDYKED